MLFREAIHRFFGRWLWLWLLILPSRHFDRDLVGRAVGARVGLTGADAGSMLIWTGAEKLLELSLEGTPRARSQKAFVSFSGCHCSQGILDMRSSRATMG